MRRGVWVGVLLTAVVAPQAEAVGRGQAPSIVTAAAASPTVVTGKTTGLSVLATDNLGEANLSYSWTSAGPAPVSFSPNQTNAAKQTLATFSSAGAYTFTGTAIDAGGLRASTAKPVWVC